MTGLVGQERAVRILECTAASDRTPSLLLLGRPGIGKRTAALLYAQAMNCASVEVRPCGSCRSCRAIGSLIHPDVRLIYPQPQKRKDDESADPADTSPPDPAPYALGRRQPLFDPTHFISIGSVRWLRKEMSLRPLSAGHRFFIILHADRMRAEAANALLKTLEEPQSASSFILTATQPGLLPPTIRSRCQVVRFGEIPESVIIDYLRRRAGVDESTARAAAALADGSLGTAFRAIDAPDETIVPVAVDYFINQVGSGSNQVLDTLTRLKSVSPSAVVNTFVFVCRAALLHRLGLESPYAAANEAVRLVAARLQPSYLRRAIRHLLTRMEDCALNLPEELLMYNVLAALRRPAATERRPPT